MMAFTIGLSAQIEVTFDFNDCSEQDQPLNGQSGWRVKVHSAGNGNHPLYTGYLGHFWQPLGDQTTPDESIGVFSVCSGTSYGDIANQLSVPTRNVEFDPCVEKAELRLVSTGHNWSSGSNGNYNTGNAAEFYEATHNININGATAYTQHLWRTCSPNPAGCNNQPGTWTYSRSGWCPGSIGLVWRYSLDDYLANGGAELTYEFDPGYIDQCHPNYPDCVNGQNNCPNCQDSQNPYIKVSGKLVTYSHHTEILLDTPEYFDVDKDPFNVTITPNPVKNQMTITTDYELGRMGVHILNAHGVEVRSFSMDSKTTIDVSDLPAGVYFVNIVGGKVVTKKVVIE